MAEICLFISCSETICEVREFLVVGALWYIGAEWMKGELLLFGKDDVLLVPKALRSQPWMVGGTLPWLRQV